MSRRLRRSSDAKQGISLFNTLCRACMVGLGNISGYLRKKPVKSNKCVKSSVTCKSHQSSEYSGTCHRNRDTLCGRADHCYGNECKHHADHDNPIERDYNEYVATVRNTEGQNVSSRVWLGNESRNTKHTNYNAANTIEQLTGIPTGTTI